MASLCRNGKFVRVLQEHLWLYYYEMTWGIRLAQRFLFLSFISVDPGSNPTSDRSLACGFGFSVPTWAQLYGSASGKELQRDEASRYTHPNGEPITKEDNRVHANRERYTAGKRVQKQWGLLQEKNKSNYKYKYL